MRSGENGYTHGGVVVEVLNPRPTFPPVFVAVDGKTAGVARSGDGERWTVEINGRRFKAYCDCTARALLPQLLREIEDAAGGDEEA